MIEKKLVGKHEMEDIEAKIREQELKLQRKKWEEVNL